MNHDLSAVEAAKALHVDLNRLYVLLRTERVQGYKLDGQWRVPLASIEKRRADLGAKEKFVPAGTC